MDQHKESIIAKIDSVADDLKGLGKEIHDNPELSLEEFRACRLLSEYLAKNGFEVEVGVDNYQTAFRASHKSSRPGPVIAFLAEYDALPTIGHGCGHNLIGPTSVGAGIATCQIVDEFGGEVRVYGTPAEENNGTKAIMVDDGVFDDCDVTLMAHPGYGDLDNMNTLAIKTLAVEFFGKASHAAGAPDLGINALDAAINMFNMVNALRQQTRSDSRIHGIIADGGKVPNIIPDYSKVVFYMRANDREYCSVLFDKLMKIAEAAALGAGCTFRTSKPHHDLDEAKQNSVLSELYVRNAESFGIDVTRAKDERMPVSSDEGNVSHLCPSIQAVFKIGTPDSGSIREAHTLGFARDAGSEMGLNASVRAAKLLAMTAYDIISDPEMMKKVKEDFENH